MFYAWITASDFSNGYPPIARSSEHNTLHAKVAGEHKRFFTAFHVDGTWVDLWTYGPPSTTFGKEVSEARSGRYVRARARKLEEEGKEEVSNRLPLPGDEEGELEPAPEFPALDDEAGKEQFNLAISPEVVSAIYQFLALDEEVRTIATNALTALSVSSEPFKSAIEIMLDDSKELTVGFPPAPVPEENTDES